MFANRFARRLFGRGGRCLSIQRTYPERRARLAGMFKDSKVSIPFTQYHLPNGRKTDEVIDRSPEVEFIADAFIESGGRYECEILTTGEVALTAVKEVDGEELDVAIIVCDNGPDIPGKVDELVKRSIAYIRKKETT